LDPAELPREQDDTNSAIDSSTRSASARAMRVSRGLSADGRLSMATPALPSTITIATSTTTISAFMKPAYRGRRARAGE